MPAFIPPQSIKISLPKKQRKKSKSAVEILFRDGEDLILEVQIPAGAVQNKWEHWDSNPDLRVSSGS